MTARLLPVKGKVCVMQWDHIFVLGTIGLTGPRVLVRLLTPMIRPAHLYINDTDSASKNSDSDWV